MNASVSGRIAQIDVLRGFAVLGMCWIAVGAFGMPYAANALPTLLGTPGTLNLTIWAATEVYMEGAVRGLFSMLFGASALIYLDEARLGSDGVAVVDRFYRRNLALILFGIIHAYLLLWPHDVLYVYGLIGLFLFPLRRAPGLALLICGLVLQTLSDIKIDWPTLASWLQGGPVPGDGTAGASAGVVSAMESARFLDWLRIRTLRVTRAVAAHAGVARRRTATDGDQRPVAEAFPLRPLGVGLALLDPRTGPTHAGFHLNRTVEGRRVLGAAPRASMDARQSLSPNSRKSPIQDGESGLAR